MSVTVLVYEKQGLKRGRGITDAHFRQWPWRDEDELEFTGGGPLGEPIYVVKTPFIFQDNNVAWSLGVYAPHHYDWNFGVRDGETHQVWLSPR